MNVADLLFLLSSYLMQGGFMVGFFFVVFFGLEIIFRKSVLRWCAQMPNLKAMCKAELRKSWDKKRPQLL